MTYLRHLFCFLGLSVALFARANDPLPVKEVFVPTLSSQAEGAGFVTTITVNFPEHYYLYVDKTTVSSTPPAKIELPAGKVKNDPYLGMVKVWTHPPTLRLSSPVPLQTVTLKLQGCEEDVICYPPTTWQLTVPPVAKPAPPQGNLQSLFQKKNDLLDERDAFQVSAEPTPAGALSVTMTLPDGYYVYKKSFRATLAGQPVLLPLPAGDMHHDNFLGDQEIYRHSLQFSLTPTTNAAQDLVLHFQGCADERVCYPPMTREFSFPAEAFLPAAPAPVAESTPPAPTKSAAPRDERVISQLNDHFWLTLPLLLLLGVGVSFTACVYPLIPIVTSLVVGKNTPTRRAYGLIVTYVMAMGAAMGLLGMVFGIFEINLQVVLQKPWIAVVVAGIFVLLALSLFDVYTLQTPRWLQKPVDKLTRQQQSGSYLGAAVMGALSVLVVSPCATPILTALLLFTTQTTPLKGAGALFTFGLGMGAPLLLFAGALRQFMPRAGRWMDGIKKAFGFALLAVAGYLLTRIMPLAWALATWALYALLLAVFLFDAQNKKRLFGAGVALLVAIALAVESGALWFAPNGAQATVAITVPGERFERVATLSAIETALQNSAQPVIVDFYADWCVACKKWEAEIWHNRQFLTPLAGYRLLKVDVTDFTPAHKAIFQRLGLVGPPAVLFYPPHGEIDAPTEKIIGEMTPADFAALLTELARK